MSVRIRRRSFRRGLLRGSLLLLALGGLASLAGAVLVAQEPQPTAPPPAPPAVQPPPAAQPAPAVTTTAVIRQGQVLSLATRAARRFQFTIPADAPLKDLLPTPPAAPAAGPAAVRTLVEVPEVAFAAPAKAAAGEEAHKQTAHAIAKVNHLNAQKADGFMDALRGNRADLAGLPFAMGDACRTKGERSRELTRAVATVRAALRGRTGVQTQAGTVVLNTAEVPTPAPAPPAVPAPAAQPAPAVPPPAPVPQQVAELVTDNIVTFTSAVAAEPVAPGDFWERYTAACAREDKQASGVDRARQEHVLLARIAALMQVLAPEAPAVRLGLVKYLAAVSHAEATRALARLAIFSEEDEVRQAAITALKVRRERDYTDVLLRGLRYPWPAVAQRAAEAVAKLERTDLVPALVDLLDEPDPRAPVAREEGGKRVQEVRELVRVNHHRNCLLCHAPANAGGVSPETLTASVPVPGEPLPSPSEGYQIASPDESVRIDVTYLRQDFSALMAVADAHPWPEMQRFDFLVRTRAVAEDEAAAVRKALAPAEPDRPSPYHRATLAALRDLTGRDAAPTAEAWRKLLNLRADARPPAPAG
ncbi:MAG TPA: HEAT repeat domain-containing protein [Gemmataceae bacterium]